MEYSKSGFTLAMAACGALFMAACAGKKDSATKPFATAEVSGFAANTVSGSAVFTSADQSGVRIQGDFKGLSPNSKYAIHVHEKGSCETPDATGPHFDPSQSNMHGGPDATAGTHHAGDLPNQIGRASCREREERSGVDGCDEEHGTQGVPKSTV